MRHMKEIATAAGTLAIAIGIGFVMQRSESAQQHYGKSARPQVVEPKNEAAATIDLSSYPTLNGAASADILLQVQDIELTSANDPSDAPDIRDDPHISSHATDLSLGLGGWPEIHGCDISATSTAIPGALVNLVLNAPCAPNERLTVHHNGMLFTETTDDTGKLALTVPALTDQAVFIMAFSNGDGAVTQVYIPDIADFHRTVLQWRGQSGFELHAREFGAAYDDSGHIWSGIEQNIAGMIAGQNGVMFRLGDYMSAEPLLAQVYTFPSAHSKSSGIVDMTIEAEVTATNCGLEIEAQSLEMTGAGQMKTHDLTLAVPDCNAVGSFLVLNNLISDLTVASN